MMPGRQLPPIDETTVIPAGRARSASGKRLQPISHVCAVIFRLAETDATQANPACSLREHNDIALATFLRVTIPSASPFKVHNRPSPAV
jgi:hypothetical protein